MIVSPMMPQRDTVVFVEVTAAPGSAPQHVEIRCKGRSTERAVVHAGETASRVVGFWGSARPLRIMVEGRTAWSGAATTSLSGPNHIHLTVRNGEVIRSESAVDDSIEAMPTLPNRQRDHIRFQMIK